MQPHRGVLILVLGILSVLQCYAIILGPIAFFMGSADIRKMDEGLMDPTGRGMTQAGRILGLIGAIIGVIILVIRLALFATQGQ